jgi:hypothetical protein
MKTKASASSHDRLNYSLAAGGKRLTLALVTVGSATT